MDTTQNENPIEKAKGIFGVGQQTPQPTQQKTETPQPQQQVSEELAIPQGYDARAVNAARAIRKRESGANYNAVGDNGTSHGAYQWQPATWQAHAKEAGLDPNDFSPKNQDEVAYRVILNRINQGYTVPELAAEWNAGDRNAYKNFNQAHGNTPQYAQDVNNIYQELKAKQGGMQAAPEIVKQPTFVGNIIRGIAKLPARAATNIINAGQTLVGHEATQPFSGSYLGEVKPIGVEGTMGERAKDIAGASLEALSYLPTGAAFSTGIKGLKAGSILGTGLKTAAEGATAGALSGAGTAMQEGKGAGEIATNALVGGTTGGILGGVLGGGGAAASKGIRAAGALSKATGLIKPTIEDAEKAVNQVAQEYERAAGTGIPNSFRRRQTTRTGDLKPWSKTLAEYGIVPEEGIDKNWDVEKALGDVDALNEEFGKTKQQFIKNENALFNVDEALNNAFSKIDESAKSEVTRQAAKNRLTQEVNAILKNNVQRDANGNRIVDAKTMERLRDVGYELTPFNASDPQKIGQSAGYSLAKAVNEQIDKQGTFPAYRAFNKEWSNILNAQEALNHLTTKKVRLAKGLSGQIAMKALGPILGYSKGGIIGAVLGDLGAETAGRLLSDPRLRTIVQRSIIEKAGTKMPKEEIISALENEIRDYVSKQQGLPQLPSPAPIQPGAQAMRQQGVNKLGYGQEPIQTTGEIKTPQSIRQEQSAMQAGEAMKKRQGLLKKKEEIPNKQGGFISIAPYKGETDLTTKILKDLEGKTTVSKQYILDATNRGDLKQAERDIVRQALETEGDKVNVADFAQKVKAELLPLKILNEPIIPTKAKSELKKLGYKIQRDMADEALLVDSNGNYPDYNELPENVRKLYDIAIGNAQDYSSIRGAKYESVTLPEELRGNVKNYKENIYESPIKTSAGGIHFSTEKNPGYFGHTRIEDMADNKTRRVIEVQSDLYQKGNLEREVADRFDPAKTQLSKDKANKLFDYTKRLSGQGENLSTKEITEYRKLFDEAKTLHENTVVSSRNKELSKLQQYNDPTAHFRMVREEIKKAAEDGKTKLQFPTGETAMKIEGLGDNVQFYDVARMNETRANGMASDLQQQGEALSYATLKPTELKVGQEVSQGAGNKWIITDVLGDGKFKAVPKRLYDDAFEAGGGGMDRMIDADRGQRLRDYQETFDISGKVDTSNPIYKFYEKEMQKYLTKFGGKKVVDDKGVSWIEVPIKKEWAKLPVEAFGKIMLSPLMIGAGLSTAGAVTAGLLQKRTRDKNK